jgi:integrase
MRRVADDDRRFNFTDTRLERYTLPEGRSETYLFDEGKTNLVLRVRGTSKVFYYLRTDGKSGKTVKQRIGPLGENTVEEARHRADDISGGVAKAGGAVPKRERLGPTTLGDAFGAYIAGHVAEGGRCEVQYRRLYRLYLERYGKMRMDELTPKWVKDAIKVGVVNAKGLDAKRVNARKSGGRATANAVLALLSTVFNHYLRTEDEEGKRINPCDRVEPYRKQARRKALTEDEARRFIDAIETYKREHAVYAVTRTRLGWVKGQPIPKKVDLADLLLIALLTGRRRGSIARMKWDDVNLDTANPTWTIPAADNKTGVEDRVMLPVAVAQLLRERRERADGPFVLPGALGGDRKSSTNKVADPRSTFRAILQIAGITRKGLVVHSLRATYITIGLRMKHSMEDVRNAVGHASISSTQGYAELLDDDKRRTSDAITDRMLNGGIA